MKCMRSQTINFSLMMCLFCQRQRFQSSNGSRKLEPLSFCQGKETGDRIKAAAEAKDDSNLLLQIRDKDLFAIGIRYHHSCYRCYTRTLKEKSPKTEENGVHETALNMVNVEISNKVIHEKQPVQLSELYDLYKSTLSDMDIDISHCRPSRFKEHLIKCFADKISFLKPNEQSKSEFVTPNMNLFGPCFLPQSDSNFTNEMAAEETTPTKQAVTFAELYHASKSLRKELLEVKTNISWPPSMQDIDHDKANIPASVYNFLAWILSDDIEFSSTQVNIHQASIKRQTQSIGQDLIHLVNKGRVKTPKHIALPIAIKSLTGSAELITILNRFGHSLSYSQEEEAETAIAKALLEQEGNGVLLPSICTKGVFGTFCWDNNDIQEETLSGKGTTHCTNGIVIQKRPDICMPDQIRTNTNIPKKSRSFSQLPSNIDPYITRGRASPSPVALNYQCLVELQDDYFSAKEADFAWLLSRMDIKDNLFSSGDNNPSIPHWTAFFVQLSTGAAPRQNVIGYCPTIPSSPTELTTVHSLLRKSLAMADQLGQVDCPIVLDQAIYAKAQEIIWQNPEEFKRVVLRLGSFHITCAYLAVIGKRFGDAGLEDLFIESTVLASGSASGVLEGRHYNRAMRIHKLLYEALEQLRWESFGEWLAQENSAQDINHSMIIEAIAKLQQETSMDHFEEVLHLPEFLKAFQQYQVYCLKYDGPMKSFWSSYLDMVSLLLCFIRATREANWHLHVACVKAMLPYFHSYDRQNYARYLPVYWAEMVRLEKTHPMAFQEFTNGNFGVQRNKDFGFTQLPVDQTIEQTINKNTKTKGGIIGFSLKKGAVDRWIITSHERCAITDKCREMADIYNDISSTHKEATKARVIKDNNDVSAIKTIVKTWGNPFQPSEELVNLATGQVATDEEASDLLFAKEKGLVALREFVETRLITGSTDIHAPMKRLNLKTFADRKQANLKQNSKSSLQQADRNIFARLLIIAQCRDISLKDVLTYELGPLPWSLVSADGSLSKTAKSSLHSLLEHGLEPMTNHPHADSIIIDFMAVLQSLKHVPTTFSELAEELFDNVIKSSRPALRVDVVTDQYPTISIKSPERQLRSKGGEIRIKIDSGSQKCPVQWKKYLSCSANKVNLVEYLSEDWAFRNMLLNWEIFLYT